MATASDWSRPPRQMIQTAYWYLHTDQFRYDGFGVERLAAPTGGGLFAGKTAADVIAQSARMGWMPSQPTFDRNPLDLCRRRGARRHVRARLRGPGTAGRPPPVRRRGPGRAGELPAGADDLAGQPARVVREGQRVLPQAPARHRLLVAGDGGAAARRGRATSCGATRRPIGKLDLLLTLDFRMTSTTVYSDVVLPAATWYEKHDLNTTDMHPFVHSFNPAIAPPWQTRTDFDTFSAIARRSATWRRPTSGCATTWSRCRCSTTPRTRWRTRTGSSATGRPASATRCPA